MNKSLRTLSAIVVAILILLSTAACAENVGLGETTTDNLTVAETTASAEETMAENTAEKLSLPDDLKFDNLAVNVLYWSDVENAEFFVDELEAVGSKVNQAIESRNSALQDRMGIVLKFTGVTGRITGFFDRVKVSFEAGDHDFDILAGYSQTMASCAYNSYLYNLNTAKDLDFSKPWWPTLLTEEATVNDRLYFVSGDISTNMLYMMYTVFFNKNLLATRPELPSPYDLINSNEWTIDKMFEMCTGFYSDLDSDTSKSSGDQYGFILPKGSIDALFYGSNLRTTDNNAGNKLVISETYFSEKAQNLQEKLFAILYDSNDGLWQGSTNIFVHGRALFYSDRAVTAVNNFGDVSFEYGVVPTPKWDSDQDNYYTCAGNPFTLYGIMTNCQIADECSAVLECWGYEGYVFTTPAIFEVTMKIRFAKDSETAKMYDMIRSGITFDLGRFYGVTMDNLTQTLYRDAMTNRTNWISKKAVYTKQLNAYLKKVNSSAYGID